jgi:hypothetical protein
VSVLPQWSRAVEATSKPCQSNDVAPRSLTKRRGLAQAGAESAPDTVMEPKAITDYKIGSSDFNENGARKARTVTFLMSYGLAQLMLGSSFQDPLASSRVIN